MLYEVESLDYFVITRIKCPREMFVGSLIHSDLQDIMKEKEQASMPFSQMYAALVSLFFFFPL